MNSKKQVDRIIQEELEQALLNEGIADWVKKGANAASAAWNKIADKLKRSTSGLKRVLASKLEQVQKVYPEAIKHYKAIKAIETQSEEKIPTNQTLKIAQEIPSAAKEAMTETSTEKQEVAAAINKNPQGSPSQAQEAYVAFTNQLFLEMAKRSCLDNENLNENDKKVLKEIAPFGIVGLALGAVGGIPLLIKGLMKLAKFFKLSSTVSFLEKVYHVAHAIEEKTIDFVVPDRLSYAVYKKWYLAVTKQGEKSAMPFEEYKKSKIRAKVEKNMYVVLLVPFLLQGISGIAHAGLSLLGAAEGAATTVKAVEIGNAVIAAAASLGAKAV